MSVSTNRGAPRGFKTASSATTALADGSGRSAATRKTASARSRSEASLAAAGPAVGLLLVLRRRSAARGRGERPDVGQQRGVGLDPLGDQDGEGVRVGPGRLADLLLVRGELRQLGREEGPDAGRVGAGAPGLIGPEEGGLGASEAPGGGAVAAAEAPVVEAPPAEGEPGRVFAVPGQPEVGHRQAAREDGEGEVAVAERRGRDGEGVEVEQRALAGAAVLAGPAVDVRRDVTGEVGHGHDPVVVGARRVDVRPAAQAFLQVEPDDRTAEVVRRESRLARRAGGEREPVRVGDGLQLVADPPDEARGQQVGRGVVRRLHDVEKEQLPARPARGERLQGRAEGNPFGRVHRVGVGRQDHDLAGPDPDPCRFAGRRGHDVDPGMGPQVDGDRHVSKRLEVVEVADHPNPVLGGGRLAAERERGEALEPVEVGLGHRQGSQRRRFGRGGEERDEPGRGDRLEPVEHADDRPGERHDGRLEREDPPPTGAGLADLGPGGRAAAPEPGDRGFRAFGRHVTTTPAVS